MAAIATPNFSVVACKMCERCGRNFVHSIESPSAYCKDCVAFFTAFAALSAVRENEPFERPRKKTGPKPGSVRFAVRHNR
jgi:hypothetical protein